jgi:hypothetical protein
MLNSPPCETLFEDFRLGGTLSQTSSVWAHPAGNPTRKTTPTPISHPHYLQRMSRIAITCSSAFSGLGSTL